VAEFVAGLDGTKAGWVAALWSGPGSAVELRAVKEIAEVLLWPDRPSRIAVDIPIGFLDEAVPGGRECDRLARKRIGARRASVFSPPVRAALAAKTYEDAKTINRANSSDGIGISKQSYFLFPKMREVDAVMQKAEPDLVHEAHPEVSFAQLNGALPLSHYKKTAEGRTERIRLLESAKVLGVKDMLAKRSEFAAGPDDVLDAIAVSWTAWRIANGQAIRLPKDQLTDSRSLPMAIQA